MEKKYRHFRYYFSDTPENEEIITHLDNMEGHARNKLITSLLQAYWDESKQNDRQYKKLEDAIESIFARLDVIEKSMNKDISNKDTLDGNAIWKRFHLDD